MKPAHIDSNRSRLRIGQQLCCLLVITLGLTNSVRAQAEQALTSVATRPQTTSDVQRKQDPRLVTVEELMRLDAQAALRLARRNQYEGPQTSVLPSSVASQPIEADQMKTQAVPVVQAIYGIGRALTAEVQLGQDLHILEQKIKPAARQGRGTIELEKIEPPCVHLKKDNRIEVLCLKQVKP